jgi:hypothetical protein
MTIPTPDQSWVFETEKSHAGRLVSILSCDVNSSHSSPTDGPGTRSFTIVDTHQPALVFSTHPPSLLPPETLKYLTRVFRLDGTCADAGWLLHHPKMRALVCDPKCTNAEPSVSSYSLQPRDTGALTTPSAFHPSIHPSPIPHHLLQARLHSRHIQRVSPRSWWRRCPAEKNRTTRQWPAATHATVSPRRCASSVPVNPQPLICST